MQVTKTWVLLHKANEETPYMVSSGRDLTDAAVAALVTDARVGAFSGSRIEVKTASYEQDESTEVLPVGKQIEPEITESSVFYEVGG